MTGREEREGEGRRRQSVTKERGVAGRIKVTVILTVYLLLQSLQTGTILQSINRENISNISPLVKCCVVF